MTYQLVKRNVLCQEVLILKFVETDTVLSIAYWKNEHSVIDQLAAVIDDQAGVNPAGTHPE